MLQLGHIFLSGGFLRERPGQHEFGLENRPGGGRIYGRLIRWDVWLARPASAAVCFVTGTRIWTPNGEIRVEDLRNNDRVITFSGEAKPIQWIGRRRVQWTEENSPIRVAQSALGPNNPHRDLYVSHEHALYLDGVLIAAGDLLNDQTIVRCQVEGNEIEYFHINLQRHDIIFTEGAACRNTCRYDHQAL